MTDKVIIALPKQLYNEIKSEIKTTGFSSPSEWIRFILRQALAASKTGNKDIISFPYLGKD